MTDIEVNKFHGKPCRTCGGTLRYRTRKAAGKCVACAKSQGSVSALPDFVPVDMSITAETSQPTFIAARPCKRCGSKVRYMKSGKNCVRCKKQWRRDNEKFNPRYKNELARKLGITRQKYWEMVESQDWRCFICKEIPKILVPDHCHTSGNFRGLICSHCNSGLGFFKDNPERLAAAIEYLRSC